jgi:hypothetical protein
MEGHVVRSLIVRVFEPTGSQGFCLLSPLERERKWRGF